MPSSSPLPSLMVAEDAHRRGPMSASKNNMEIRISKDNIVRSHIVLITARLLHRLDSSFANIVQQSAPKIQKREIIAPPVLVRSKEIISEHLLKG